MGTFSMQLDPHDQYLKNVTPDQLVEALGLIPSFIEEISRNTQPDANLDLDLAQAYGFPMPPMEGGAVRLDGVYTYPDDPPLVPMCCYLLSEYGNLLVYQYQYGITAVQQPDKTFITYRMD